jgi:hypothetical protein
MGRKWAKKQVVTLGKILTLYGFMLIEPKQGTACITQVIYSSKAFSPGGFYPKHKPAHSKRRDQTHLAPNGKNLKDYKFKLEMQVRMKAFQSQVPT